MYLAVLQRLGLLGDAVWHATSFDEAGRVHANFGREARVVIAPAIPMGIPMPAGRPEKEKGRLDLIFLSRISRKKNLGFLIEALRGSRGQINLEVIGPIEDHRYWWECRRAASSLPANVRFRYAGIADPEEVPAVLEQHHLFVLPTLGENFGHAIVESLLSGCPVLISDQTPWRNLEARRAGWDLSLSDPQGFCRAIERCVDMDARQFDEWSVGARQLGLEIAEQPESVDSYISLFQMALSPDTAR